MDEQQIREIAEAAFNRPFADVEIVRINVWPGFGFEDDTPVVDVNIIYDSEYEQLNSAVSRACCRSSSTRHGGEEGRPRLALRPLHSQVGDRSARPGHGLTPWRCDHAPGIRLLPREAGRCRGGGETGCSWRPA